MLTLNDDEICNVSGAVSMGDIGGAVGGYIGGELGGGSLDVK